MRSDIESWRGDLHSTLVFEFSQDLFVVVRRVSITEAHHHMPLVHELFDGHRLVGHPVIRPCDTGVCVFE